MKSVQTFFLTIGSKNSRRVKFWEAALDQQQYPYGLLTYEQVFSNDFPIITSPTILRITSPGEDFELKKMLLGLGGFANHEELFFEKGLVYPNTHWYHGWSIMLRKISSFINANPLIKVINHPRSILLAFHKLNCQKLLSQNDIKTPEIFLDQVWNYDLLMAKLERENIPQVFIKPYHGSSASGVMALRHCKGKQVLYTTLELKNGKLYNSLRLQKYASIEKIKTIITTMIPAGLLVEEWIRKKKFQNKSVDFRILIINGKAVFTVPRMSHHIITNLHLGNEKGAIKEVEESWGTSLIDAAKELAIKAVDVVGGLFYAGVDVAISKHGEPYVLEINAFGDLLIGIQKEGLNTYEYELQEWNTSLHQSAHIFTKK